jgi:hypothetical protein
MELTTPPVTVVITDRSPAASNASMATTGDQRNSDWPGPPDNFGPHLHNCGNSSEAEC